jgi:hypothetical protein
MRSRLSCGLTLSLGLLVGQAEAEDVLWRPAAVHPAVAVADGMNQGPAVTMGRPGPLAATRPGQAVAGVSLGQPAALQAPTAERQFQTVAFRTDPSEAGQPVFRAKKEDPQPLPVGPPPKPVPPVDDLSFMGPNSHPLPAPAGPDLGSMFGVDGCPPPFAADMCCNPCPVFCCGSHGACCFDTCCGPCDRPYCFWASADFLLWTIKDSRTTPLVTTSPVGTPQSMAGVLGTGAAVLYGGPDIENEEFKGGRFTAGAWLDPCKTIGLEASFMFLGRRNNYFLAGSSGTPILARPFMDAGGFENAQLIAFPGVISGSVVVDSQSSLWGAEGNLRCHAWCCCLCGGTFRADLLAGFRFLELKEKLTITELLVVPDGSVVPRAPGPATILVQDSFRTHNQFYGGQIGADTEYHYGRWFAGATAKVALGTMHEVVTINGFTTLTTPSVVTTAAGGLLAQPTNIGQYSHDRLAVIPEVGLKLGYQVNDHVRVYVGYDFLYVNNVVRPGDQIDRVVNVTQIPNITSPPSGEPVRGIPRPSFNFKDTDFWAQGFNVGLEIRY